MKVILKQDVEQVGTAGEIVNVSDGYCRNFLLPRGFAMLATTRSVSEMDHRKRLVADKIARELKSATSVKTKLESLSVKIARETGEEDRLFGSVTNRDIADALAEDGVEVDHRKIKLETPIKNLGIYHVAIKLGRDIEANVKVWVVAK